MSLRSSGRRCALSSRKSVSFSLPPRRFAEQAQAGFSDKKIVAFGDAEIPLFLVELEIADVRDSGDIVLRLSSETTVSDFVFRIDAGLDAGYEYNKI